jgi:F5/8 type C domain-containing protein
MNVHVRNVSLTLAFILGLIVGLDLTYQNSYALPALKHTIKVTFDSITVHNDHDGFARGAGEWYNYAFVQGKLVVLEMEPDTDDTINLGKEIAVQLDGTTPLSIFTVGFEQDYQGVLPYHNFCKAIPGTDLSIFNSPASDWPDGIEKYLRQFLEAADEKCDTDRLGRINEFYDPTAYGAGAHEVKSHTGDFTLKYTVSVSKTANIGPLAPQPLQHVCNSNLPITSVTASGDDGHVPQNVLDNNLDTRWASDGVGQFITADLGSIKNICSVDIAWYLGNQRMYGFQISASTDGSSFKKLLTTSSSGNTLNSEKYTDIPPTDARYVRVTVTGNTVNNFASITELDIFG